jgi:hypothetical protein
LGEVNSVLAERRVEFEGVAYRVTRQNFKTEAMYEEFLERRALEGLQRQRRLLGEDGYQKALGIWMEKVASGDWSWGREAMALSLPSPECLKELLFLVVCQEHKEMNRTLWERLWPEKAEELARSWQEVIGPNPTTPPPASGASA